MKSFNQRLIEPQEFHPVATNVYRSTEKLKEHSRFDLVPPTLYIARLLIRDTNTRPSARAGGVMHNHLTPFSPHFPSVPGESHQPSTTYPERTSPRGESGAQQGAPQSPASWRRSGNLERRHPEVSIIPGLKRPVLQGHPEESRSLSTVSAVSRFRGPQRFAGNANHGIAEDASRHRVEVLH